jgi:hypothetical protein
VKNFPCGIVWRRPFICFARLARQVVLLPLVRDFIIDYKNVRNTVLNMRNMVLWHKNDIDIHVRRLTQLCCGSSRAGSLTTRVAALQLLPAPLFMALPVIFDSLLSTFLFVRKIFINAEFMI